MSKFDAIHNKFESILQTVLKIPGVRINREDFLRNELSRYFEQDIVESAIQKNPAAAGLGVKDIEIIAKSCIKNETSEVTAISTIAGIPGGFALIGTVPADAIQYFIHIFRILQKLIYLYGWQELFDSDGKINSGSLNLLILFVGVMFDVEAAYSLVYKIAKSAAQKTDNVLIQKALSYSSVCLTVKEVTIQINDYLRKELFVKGISKIVPVIGGVCSGGLTYVTFKPMAKRLQKYLAELPTSDVDFNSTRQNEDNSESDFPDDENLSL